MLLQDQATIVTGVGAGMGRAFALRCAAEGARVIGADVDEERGRDTMDKAGGTFVRCDVGDLAAIEALVNTAIEQLGRIDFLVNNAGVTKSLGFFDVTEADWDRIYRVNAKGLFFCMQAVARQMREQRSGRIVNIASIAGKEGNPNAVAYSASKAGVISLTKSLGKELARSGVLVNCVTPAAAKTAIFDQMTEEHINYMLSKIPMNRFVNVDEIASLVCWLASADCSFSTGGVFDISGGRATY
jgi:3-oxoacyl-[acyl-carrier protein] reductase